MSDLRKAAEMALDALNEVTGWQWGGPMRVMDEVEDAIQALRQALAQEQEPVAWFVQYEYRHEFLWRKPNELEQDTALEITPLYTAPPKREWVGLTGLEQKELMAMNSRYAVFETEAKLKEKNT